jgi:hypothetical protein
MTFWLGMNSSADLVIVTESACVKAFRCRPITTGRHTLWPASESRQGKNPREVGGRSGCECYGDLWVARAVSATCSDTVVRPAGLTRARMSLIASTITVGDNADDPANCGIRKKNRARDSAAGIAVAARTGQNVREQCRGVGHDVSILIRGGRYRGWLPGSNNSTIIIRPPQQAQR